MDACTPAATADLLGLLAYAEFTGYLRLTADAELAPRLEQRLAIAALASAEFHQHTRLATHLKNQGHDPLMAMRPFVAPLDAFAVRTAPTSWAEALVKIFVVESMATDAYTMFCAQLDQQAADVVGSGSGDELIEGFVRPELQEELEANPQNVGTLSMWGRRLVGELLSQGQRIVSDRPHLAMVVRADGASAPLSAFSELSRELVARHEQRFTELGFSA